MIFKRQNPLSLFQYPRGNVCSPEGTLFITAVPITLHTLTRVVFVTLKVLEGGKSTAKRGSKQGKGMERNSVLNNFTWNRAELESRVVTLFPKIQHSLRISDEKSSFGMKSFSDESRKDRFPRQLAARPGIDLESTCSSCLCPARTRKKWKEATNRCGINRVKWCLKRKQWQTYFLLEWGCCGGAGGYKPLFSHRLCPLSPPPHLGLVSLPL